MKKKGNILACPVILLDGLAGRAPARRAGDPTSKSGPGVSFLFNFTKILIFFGNVIDGFHPSVPAIFNPKCIHIRVRTNVPCLFKG